MPTTKNALLRFRIIDNILRKRPAHGISKALLHDELNRRLEEAGYPPISISMVRNDLEVMMNEFDAPICVQHRNRTPFYLYDDPAYIFPLLDREAVQKLYDEIANLRRMLEVYQYNYGPLTEAQYNITPKGAAKTGLPQ